VGDCKDPILLTDKSILALSPTFLCILKRKSKIPLVLLTPSTQNKPFILKFTV